MDSGYCPKCWDRTGDMNDNELCEDCKIMKPKLIIMTGNIASGKSTWIQKFLKAEAAMAETGYVVISLDAIRRMFGAGNYFWDLTLEPVIERLGIDIMMALMAKNRNIIIDETNETVSLRQRWLDATKWKSGIGYDYHTIVAVMPYLERGSSLGRRMKGRDTAWGFSRDIWAEVWDRKQKEYKEPKRSEGFDEIWHIAN